MPDILTRYRPRGMSALDLQTVQCRIIDGVGWMTLNRPAQLNAWIRQLGDDMLEALRGFQSDPAVRAIVITGAGRAFSSGADLKSEETIRPDGTVDVLTPLRESYNPVLLTVRTMPKPVIAAVNGPAAGIGCSLALACDLVVASQSAYFLLAFVNIGLGLDGGASQSLVERVGQARAFEMAFLGERVPSGQALEWGIVNQVVADDDRARRPAGRRPAQLLRDDQAHDQRPRVRRLRRTARPRGRAAAGPGGDQGLQGGRHRVRGEAPPEVHRGVGSL
jgi:2-(1,2-epoxy-1,2-dihydrophenyl)acetyl-CoA isomerase